MPFYLQKMFWLFVLPLLASWVHVGGVSPGLKAQVNQKGLEYGRQLGLRMVNQMLKNVTIPDVRGVRDMPLLGEVQFSVTGIQINEFQLDNSTLSFAKGLGVNLTVQNGLVLLGANWKLRTLFGRQSCGPWRILVWGKKDISELEKGQKTAKMEFGATFRPDGGTVDITVSGLSLSAVLGVSKDAKGRPVVWAARCRAGIGDLRVKFHGGHSWFYNRFTSVLEVILQAKLNKQLCFEIKKGTDDLARALRAMNVSVQINSFAELDYSLVNKPFFGANRCQVDLKGEFFSPGQPCTNFFTPSSFLLPKQPDSMLLLGITEFFPNSAAWVYFSTGALQRNITDEMIPKSFPIRLNTESMGMVIPELEKKFPEMPLEVQVGARKQPEFSFHPGGVDLKIFGALEVSVILPNASLAPAFLLNIDGNFTGQFFLEPVSSGISLGKLLGTVALKRFQLSQAWSNVGNIEMKFLENALTVAAQVGLLSVNKHLKKGIVLPNVHNVNLVNPQIAMYQVYPS